MQSSSRRRGGGGIVLGVERVASAEEENGVMTLQFSVSDTGIGIDSVGQQKLFQAFSQTDASISRRFGGTGLGLMISKQLVELMGGRIWVESEPGNGSTFFFTVKIVPQSYQPERVKGDLSDVKGLKLLIVDDSPISQTILGNQLQQLGCYCEAAYTGAEAIHLLFAGGPEPVYDLVLVDSKMPDMDGGDLISHIKNNGNLVDLPCIMMNSTGKTLDRDDVKTQSHVAGFLTKPIRLSKLGAVLMNVVGSMSKDHIQEVEVDPVSTDKPRFDGVRLLLVEDNEINREIARVLLSRQGVILDYAENGLEALSKLEEQHYDAVLMDCQMPVMDGYEATRTIRQKPELKDLPIIAMTANVTTHDREKAIDSGMDDLIGKPIDVDAMFETLSRWLDSAQVKPANGLVASQDASFDLNRLSEVDVNEGMKICMGSDELYKSLLRKFRDAELNFYRDYHTALNNDNSSEAIQLVRKLKGDAFTLGMKDLSRLAGVLEMSTLDQFPDVLLSLEELNDKLQKILNELKSL